MTKDFKPDTQKHESTTIDVEEEGFFGRWSKRKLRAKESRRETVEESSKSIPQGTEANSSDDRHSIQEKSDADMPSLESLDENSDYSGFMSPKVSEALRQAALRKLFRLPKFNIRDGLDDYDEDFRQFEALGDIITADMRHQIEQAAEKVKQEHAAQTHFANEPTKKIIESEQNRHVATKELDDRGADDDEVDEHGQDNDQQKHST